MAFFKCMKYKQDLRTDHEKTSVWTIFGGAERPQKSSNCVSPAKVFVESRAERGSQQKLWFYLSA